MKGIDHDKRNVDRIEKLHIDFGQLRPEDDDTAQRRAGERPNDRLDLPAFVADHFQACSRRLWLDATSRRCSPR